MNAEKNVAFQNGRARQRQREREREREREIMVGSDIARLNNTISMDACLHKKDQKSNQQNLKKKIEADMQKNEG